MIRWIARIVGLGFVVAVLFAFGSDLKTYFKAPPEATAEEEYHLHPKDLHLASDGPFGKFDRQQVQRGFQVYKEVCSACHSAKLVAVLSESRPLPWWFFAAWSMSRNRVKKIGICRMIGRQDANGLVPESL